MEISPNYFSSVISRTFNFGFSLGLMNKDVRLCLEEAEASGVPMIVGSATKQFLSIASASEGPNADMTTMAKCVEKWSGVRIGVEETSIDAKVRS